MAKRRRLERRLNGRHGLTCRLGDEAIEGGERFHHVLAGRRAEEIDLIKYDEALTRRAGDSTESSPGRGCQSASARGAGHRAFELARQRSIIVRPRAMESRDDSLAAGWGETIGGKDRGFSAERHDLTADPFEILATGFRVRQHVHGIPR